MSSATVGNDGFPEYRPIPLAQLRAELEAIYAPPLRARSTQRELLRAFDLLAALDGVSTTADLTPATIGRFIASRPSAESPNTTHSHLARIRAGCSYAQQAGYLRVSPFAFRRRWIRKVKPTGRRHHSREEIARVLELARGDVASKKGWARWRARRLHTLVATVAYTGLRRGEALHLRVEDLDLAAGTIAVVSRRGWRTKTEAAEASVPIPAALAAILREWIPCLELPSPAELAKVPHASRARGWDPSKADPGWLFPNAYRTGPWIGGASGVARPLDRLRRLGERARVDGLTFQSLRHSWATHAEYWGLTALQIQRVLRHANPTTQEHYRHNDADNMRALIDGIRFDDAPTSPAPMKLTSADAMHVITERVAELHALFQAAGLASSAADPIRMLAELLGKRSPAPLTPSN